MRQELPTKIDKPWFVAVITGALSVGLATIPIESTSASPPSGTNRPSSCLRDLVSCCLGSATSSNDLHDGNQSVAYGNEAAATNRPIRRSDAAPLPTVLYLASNRPPSRVFDEGFPTEARGLDLLRSVLENHHSALTTPTASPIVAFNDAQALRHVNDPRFPSHIYFDDPVPVWVYEIRADTSFFDVDESILWILSQPGGSHGFRNRLDQQAVYSARLMQRWATVGVPVENIRRAYSISHDTPRPGCPESSPAHGGPASDQPPPFSLTSARHNRHYLSHDTRGSNHLHTD